MNIELSPEALAYGSTVRQALADAGGDQLVQDAEREPAKRETVFAPILAELGAWQLDPRGDADDLEAAAALCRAAGYWCTAYPLAERLARPTGGDADGLLVVAGSRPAAAVADLDLRWAAVTLDGRQGLVTAVRPDGPPRTASFVATVDITPADLVAADTAAGDTAASHLALGLVLPCWTLLGMLDRALDLTREYVQVREQFGQLLAAFQGVQFQLTDAEVERAAWRRSPSTRSGRSRPPSRPRWPTRSPCGWRRSRRLRSSSASRTSCTARSGSATSRRCPGCRVTASRCAACRSACPRPAKRW